jgi:hypothetical protein
MSAASKAFQQQAKAHISSKRRHVSSKQSMSAAASKACQRQAKKSTLTTSKEAFFVFSPSSASTET